MLTAVLTVHVVASRPTRRRMTHPRTTHAAGGYREINLNVGCPSDRGQGNCNYGAVLMQDGGGLVGACMANIIDEVNPDPAY